VKYHIATCCGYEMACGDARHHIATLDCAHCGKHVKTKCPKGCVGGKMSPGSSPGPEPAQGGKQGKLTSGVAIRSRRSSTFHVKQKRP
jgi:hypothetical protein